MSSGARSLQFAVNQLADMVEDAKGKGAFGVTTEVKSGGLRQKSAVARDCRKIQRRFDKLLLCERSRLPMCSALP
jgi:hypothetical protein